MLFGREQLVICLRIVTIWLDCGECFSLKNLKVKMIQVKPSIHNQVGFLWSPVHIDLAPRCLEDNSCHLEGIFFSFQKWVSPLLSDATAPEYCIIFGARLLLP